MIDVLFVQGGGDDVYAGWDARLVDSLRRELGPAFAVRYPRMPNEADPAAAAWRSAIARELAPLRPGAVVVGHSIGGAILLDVLADSQATPDLGAIVLIAAPFIGPGGWASNELAPRADLAAARAEAVPVFLYHGEADDTIPVAHVERYAAAIPHAAVRRLPGRDHQLNEDLSEVARDLRELRELRVARPRPGGDAAGA